MSIEFHPRSPTPPGDWPQPADLPDVLAAVRHHGRLAGPSQDLELRLLRFDDGDSLEGGKAPSCQWSLELDACSR